MSRYGTRHRKLRAELVERYEAAGRGTPCALCHQPMHDPPPMLHLAHNDDGSYAGLAHKACNIGDAGRLAFRRLRGTDDPAPRPRTKW